MDEIEKIIQEDREQHPNCGYSTSNSKTCRTKEGKFVCEVMKSVNRICPNEKPVNVYSNSTQFDSTPDTNIGLPLPNFSDAFDLFSDLKKGFSYSITKGEKNSEKSDQFEGKKEVGPSIQFRFDLGDKFNSSGGDGDNGINIGSFLKQFGIHISEDKKTPHGELGNDDSKSRPNAPSGTKVGRPEDI
jgi:hypothetical protein